jgi:hypothetical protein
VEFEVRREQYSVGDFCEVASDYYKMNVNRRI